MKAPDIIYTDGRNTCAPAPIFSNTDGNIKYIRADLAELTCGDIEKIDELIREVGQRTDIKTYQETYQEVLRRFLEGKKEIEL